MPTSPTVIIIGAGLAGLSAGVFAQLNGYQSRIFEHHAVAGGVAAAWRRKGYLIDGGIHFIMNHKPGAKIYDLYRQVGALPATPMVDLPQYGRFIDEASGASLTVTADLDRLEADLKSLFPQDASVTERLLSAVRGLRGIDLGSFGMSQPPELSRWWRQAAEMWSMRKILPYFTGVYGESMLDFSRRAQSPLFRRILQSLFLPEVPLYFVAMMLALVADGQVGLIDGSCLDFVQSIVRTYLSLGGEIHYRSTVEQILVEDDRAVGVRLADGSAHRAGAVISAGDGYNTIFKLLGGKYTNAAIRQRYQTWATFKPLLMVNFGVNRTFPDAAVFTTVHLKKPLTIGGQPAHNLILRTFNYSQRFAPPGKSVIQAEFETEWDFWNDLQERSRPAYEQEKARTAAEVLAWLETVYPGIAAQVEMTDVATPYTTWRYTLNRRGAWEGWLIDGKKMLTPIERTLPGLRDFYMAGQWVTPGGGVPPVLYTGKHAVQLLCRRDKKTFLPKES